MTKINIFSLNFVNLFTFLQLNITCLIMHRGEKMDNGSWSNLLGMLRDDKCDFIVGGFFPDNEVHVDFSVSNTYFQDTYTWLV